MSIEYFLLLWLGGIAALGIYFLWRVRITQRSFLKVLEYAGYTQNDFEFIARGKRPSVLELLEGLRRQPGRLVHQAQFLAIALERERVDAAFLTSSKVVLEDLLNSYEAGRVSNLQRTFFEEFVDEGVQVSRSKQCSPQLRMRVHDWTMEVYLWQKTLEHHFNHLKQLPPDKML